MATHTTRTVEPGITVVEISGSLQVGKNLAATETALHALIKEGARKMVVDLSGLEHIDSSGLGMLTGCRTEMSEAGGHFRLAGATGPIGRIFGVIHMDEIIPVDADVAAACLALQ
ncbi:MAG: STAS domain-containing protein [Acidobacteriota bacterium]